MSEDTIENIEEIKEIVDPKTEVQKTVEAPSTYTREDELREVASIFARKSGKPMAVIAKEGGYQLRAASKDEVKAQRNKATSFVPPVPTPTSPEPVLANAGKSSGEQWSHRTKHGDPRGPGRHRQMSKLK